MLYKSIVEVRSYNLDRNKQLYEYTVVTCNFKVLYGQWPIMCG